VVRQEPRRRRWLAAATGVEPLGNVAGVWNEVPESTCVIVHPGGAELRPFRPAAPSNTMTGVA
jgi:hypothetical protein